MYSKVNSSTLEYHGQYYTLSSRDEGENVIMKEFPTIDDLSEWKKTLEKTNSDNNDDGVSLCSFNDDIFSEEHCNISIASHSDGICSNDFQDGNDSFISRSDSRTAPNYPFSCNLRNKNDYNSSYNSFGDLLTSLEISMRRTEMTRSVVLQQTGLIFGRNITQSLSNSHTKVSQQSNKTVSEVLPQTKN